MGIQSSTLRELQILQILNESFDEFDEENNIIFENYYDGAQNIIKLEKII